MCVTYVGVFQLSKNNPASSIQYTANFGLSVCEYDGICYTVYYREQQMSLYLRYIITKRFQ